MLTFSCSGDPNGGVPIDGAAVLESFRQITAEHAAYLAKKFGLGESAPMQPPLLGRLALKVTRWQQKMDQQCFAELLRCN